MDNIQQKNMIGRRFGRWTVIAEADGRPDKKGYVWNYWLCECSCKKQTKREVKEYSLISGSSKSCGCMSAETRKENRDNKPKNDLVGRQFNEWTVLDEANPVNGSVYWKCRCSCGTIRNVPERHLLTGHSKSCGHIKDLTGNKFGRLTVISRGGTKKFYLMVTKILCGIACAIAETREKCVVRCYVTEQRSRAVVYNTSLNVKI